MRVVGEKKRFAEERRRLEALDEASRVAADERTADKVAARGETSLRQANYVESMLDDIEKARINPGYTGIGRLKGLAELRGVIRALQ